MAKIVYKQMPVPRELPQQMPPSQKLGCKRPRVGANFWCKSWGCRGGWLWMKLIPALKSYQNLVHVKKSWNQSQNHCWVISSNWHKMEWKRLLTKILCGNFFHQHLTTGKIWRGFWDITFIIIIWFSELSWKEMILEILDMILMEIFRWIYVTSLFI